MLTISYSMTEREIRSKLRKALFKNGRIHCTHCGYFRIRKISKENRYHCKRCRKKFSLFSHTWLKHIKVSLTTLLLLLELWIREYSVKEAANLSELSIPTTRRYYRLFRLNIPKNPEFKPEKDVQVDEAYFGRFKKQANWYGGVQRYRVAEKTCVAGIGCPATGQLATKVIRGRPGKPIKEFIRELVPNNIWVYSDGSPIYTSLRDTHIHWAQTHLQGFETAYYIESCWSHMKRKLFKQYHHFTKKYAEEYVSELTWRFNTRESTENALEHLIRSL